MAKYGIDRALLAATRPETDKPDNRIVEIYNPWARVQAHLLCGLAAALRCQCILLPARAGQRVHVFGYASDIERADVLYTSVLIQMWHGLVAAEVPARADNVAGLAAQLAAWLRRRGDQQGPGGRAGRRRAASAGPARESSRTALVLADRSLVIRQNVAARLPGDKNGQGYLHRQRLRRRIRAG